MLVFVLRENTLHELQDEGRRLGMRRPLVTEMVIINHIMRCYVLVVIHQVFLLI